MEYEKNDAFHNIVILESKLIKLKISPERIIELKILVCYLSLSLQKPFKLKNSVLVIKV